MLDPLIAQARLRWGLDPADGLQIVAPDRLPGFPIEPSRPLLVVPGPMMGGAAEAGSESELGSLPGRHREPPGAIAVLRRLYPADHPVRRLAAGSIGAASEAAGSEAEGAAAEQAMADTTVGELAEADLDGPLYVAPLDPVEALASPWGLPWIADRLRQPDGCPWDREQTHQSLRKHLLEEAYEVYDALEGGASPDLADELGDLLLQIVLHAQLGAEAGVFDMTDVYRAIGSKIVRRHPHVFGEAEVRTATDVNRQWERIKAEERRVAAEAATATLASAEGLEDGQAVAPRSALDGISASMPALAATQEMQERAAHLGYDWPTVDGIVAKLHEELGELQAARTPAERHEEVGDLLLVAVNLARREGVEAEAALRAAGEKFRRRFRIVERQAAERGVALRDLDFDQLDALWMAAKAEEKRS